MEILFNVLFTQDLQLEYIHGYRGFDSRDNLHYVNDGADIVFHAAGAGIVKNLPTGMKHPHGKASGPPHFHRFKFFLEKSCLSQVSK